MKIENINYLLVGASSELAQETLLSLKKDGSRVLGISREKINYGKFDDYLLVNDYIEDIREINKFVSKIENCYVIFFNGFLAENGKIKKPTIEDIVKTDLANFTIPYSLTCNFIKNLENIKKYIYISSMAAIKPRDKNYIYGLSKRKLEVGLVELGIENLLLIRFGKIKTRMSSGHKDAPFTLNKLEAANLIKKNIYKKNVIYPTFGLYLISILIKILPLNVLNFIESENTNDKII